MRRAFIFFTLFYLCLNHRLLYALEEAQQPEVKGVFYFGLTKREMEFPKRIQGLLLRIETEAKELEEIMDNNYKKIPKDSDVVSVAFTDFYKQRLFTEVLTELHKLSELCTTCQDFLYYNNQMCFLERYIKNDDDARSKYYKVLTLDVGNFLIFLEEKAFTQVSGQSKLFQKKLFEDLANLNNSAEMFFLDMRSFYKEFLLTIINNNNNK